MNDISAKMFACILAVVAAVGACFAEGTAEAMVVKGFDDVDKNPRNRIRSKIMARRIADHPRKIRKALSALDRDHIKIWPLVIKTFQSNAHELYQSSFPYQQFLLHPHAYEAIISIITYLCKRKFFSHIRHNGIRHDYRQLPTIATSPFTAPPQKNTASKYTGIRIPANPIKIFAASLTLSFLANVIKHISFVFEIQCALDRMRNSQKILRKL